MYNTSRSGGRNFYQNPVRTTTLCTPTFCASTIKKEREKRYVCITRDLYALLFSRDSEKRLAYKVMYADCHTYGFVVATSQESFVQSSFLRNLRRAVSPKVSYVATAHMVRCSNAVSINFNEPNDTTREGLTLLARVAINEY